MAFKLRSQVVVDVGPEYTPVVAYPVLFRERVLNPGDIIKAKGSVAADIEAKSSVDADVKIRIIDDENLRITFEPTLISRLFFPEHKRYFPETEKVVNGKDVPNLEDDSYERVWRYTFQEAFTLLDRIRIPHLVRSKLNQVEGIKGVRRETELRYEPTISPETRK